MSVCCQLLCLPHSKTAVHVDMILFADMDQDMVMDEMAVCDYDEGGRGEDRHDGRQ